MTDEQMDARLHAAGEQWRERVDGDTLTTDSVDGEHDEVLPIAPPRRRRTWFVAVAAAAVVMLIAGLTFALRGAPRHAPPNAEAAGVQGTVWLVRGNGSTAALYIGPNGALVADDECRLIGGHASVTGHQLTITDLVVRYKACTDQYGPGFYDSGTTVLRGTSTYSIDSQGLTITHGAGSLRFAPAPRAVPPPSLDVPTLTDTTWRAPDGKTLRIDAMSGNVSGTICAGRATLAGSAVTFTGCRPPVGQGTYLATISGVTLTLKAQTIDPGFSGMSEQLTFSWQPIGASIDPAALTNRVWSLRAVAGRPASSGSLNIADGVARIDDGCLSSDRPVRVRRGTMSISGSLSKRPCPSPATTIESVLLSDPATWAIRGGTLTIYGGGSQTFSLVYRTAKPHSSTLQGDWTITTIAVSPGHARPATASAELRIAADGTVSGTDGCRSFTGAVKTNGAIASFVLTMPEPACAPRVERTAGLVDRLLGGAVSFAVRNDQLMLARDGVGQVTFTDRPVNGAPQLLTPHGWQIETITYGTGHFRNGAAAQDGGAQLSFTGETYRIEHACYIVSGTARLASGVVTFGTPNRNDHSCPPPPAAGSVRDVAAQAIDKILTGQVRWSIDGSVLTLSDSQGSLRAVGGVPSDLTGSRWRLIGTARGNSSSTAVGSVVLSFPSAQQLIVERCYTSSAQVEVGDSSFVAVDLHTTIARPCPSGPPGTQQQNHVIDSVLAGQVMWSIARNSLTLSADGASLTFRR